MRRTLSLAFALALVATCAHAQTILYVDAVAGNDRSGDGSPGKPYRTLTTAVQSAPPRVATTFRLRPGTHDSTLGEAFPIALPERSTVEADPATVVPQSFAVQLVTDPALGATFTVQGSGPHAITLRGLRMRGGQFRGLQTSTQGSGNRIDLLVEDCEITQSRCLAIEAQDATASVVIRRCALTGPDTPLIVRGLGGASMDVTLDRCTVRNGLSTGILLDASGTSVLRLRVLNSWFHQQSKAGITALSTGGAISTVIEHCLFHAIGALVIGGSPGAIVDTLGSGGVPPRHTIDNTIFHGCKNDAPGYQPATYAFRTCLVQQPNLAALGGNILGTGTFENDGKERYRPRPGSLAVDRGTTSAVTEDLAGQPRNGPFAPGPPDIGPYELHPGATWLEVNAQASGAATLVQGALGSANAPAVMFLASGERALPWTPGLHLAGVILPFFAGVCDRDGILTQVTALPAGLVPIGTEAWFQPAFLQGSLLGPNAAHFVMRGQ